MLFLFAGACDASEVLLGDRDDPPPIGQADNPPATLNTPAAPPSATPAPAEDPDIALSNKLGKYVACVNGYAESVTRTEERYALWVDMEKGPTGKERHTYGLYEVGDPEWCTKSIAEAKAAAPSLPELETAAAAYAEALDALHPLIDEAYRYYDRENYKDDGFAKGKELHPKLVAGWKAFHVAHESFAELLGEHQDGLQERRLAKLEAKGRNLEYMIELSMFQAKRITEAASVAGADEFEKVDLEQLGPWVDEFERLSDEMVEYAKTHKEEVDKNRMYSSYGRETEDFAKSAKSFYRRAKENKKLSQSERRTLRPSLTAPEGTFPHLVHRYNRMVETYNRY